MKLEIITEETTLVIRRLTLEPNEPMYWHTDQCRRFTVIVSGDRLRIEYRDSEELDEFEVHQGMVGWDDPEPRTHRAVNVGRVTYEEIVTFYRNSDAVEPQPTD